MRAKEHINKIPENHRTIPAVLRQRKSNMHQFEGHHFVSPFAPCFLVGAKQWIHTGDPVVLVGIPTEKGILPVPDSGRFPFFSYHTEGGS